MADEADCIKAARDALKRYFLSLDIDHEAPAFSGQNWDDAIRRFRNYCQNHYICNHCHDITRVENISNLDYACTSCKQGKYINDHKDIWKPVLENAPQKQRHFTANDPFTASDVDFLQVSNSYVIGFLIKTSSDKLDRNIMREFQTTVLLKLVK